VEAGEPSSGGAAEQDAAVLPSTSDAAITGNTTGAGENTASDGSRPTNQFPAVTIESIEGKKNTIQISFC
jgi:hypothetical protein